MTRVFGDEVAATVVHHRTASATEGAGRRRLRRRVQHLQHFQHQEVDQSLGFPLLDSHGQQQAGRHQDRQVSGPASAMDVTIFDIGYHRPLGREGAGTGGACSASRLWACTNMRLDDYIVGIRQAKPDNRWKRRMCYDMVMESVSSAARGRDFAGAGRRALK